MRRKTKQYEVVLRIMRENRAHLSADEVYAMARRELPNISLATVYRNLRDMTKQGLLLEIRTEGEDKVRFDGFTKPHYHFKCLRCGRIYDLDPDLYENALDGKVQERYGHRVKNHQVVFYGICRECAEKEPPIREELS